MNKFFAFLICLFLSSIAFAQSPIGKWKTIDDVTGKPRAIVEIYEYQGKLYGKVVDLMNLTPEEGTDPVCKVCSGSRKDKKIRGMILLTGLSKSNGEWTGGEILDPKNGKTYSCTISLENADKLKVRGYIGFSVIGRTQYWYREK